MKNFLFTILFTLGSSAAFAQKIENCQHPSNITFDNFAYELAFEIDKPILNSQKSASNLSTMQSQYYSEKTGPFAKNIMPPTLGFFLPNIEVNIAPQISYSATLNNKHCASVHSASITIKAAPEIFLSSELTARDCVATQALLHQLKHQQVLENLLKEAKEKKEIFKEDILSVYKPFGIAGEKTEDIEKGLDIQRKKIESLILKRLLPVLKKQQRTTIDNNKNLSELINSCNGAFAKTIELGLKKK